MGRTIAKECSRCGRLNYVDVDADVFVCPGCQCRIEVDEEDRKMTDKAMKKIVTPGRKESRLYEKAESKPWGVLILCIVLIVAGVLIYNNRDIIMKGKDSTAEDKERVDNNKTKLLSYFSFPFKGEINGTTYQVQYYLATQSFEVVITYGKTKETEMFTNVEYMNPDTLHFSNDEGVFEIRQVITKNAAGEDIQKARLKVVSFSNNKKIYDAIGYSKLELTKVG